MAFGRSPGFQLDRDRLGPTGAARLPHSCGPFGPGLIENNLAPAAGQPEPAAGGAGRTRAHLGSERLERGELITRAAGPTAATQEDRTSKWRSLAGGRLYSTWRASAASTACGSDSGVILTAKPAAKRTQRNGRSRFTSPGHVHCGRGWPAEPGKPRKRRRPLGASQGAPSDWQPAFWGATATALSCDN